MWVRACHPSLSLGTQVASGPAARPWSSAGLSNKKHLKRRGWGVVEGEYEVQPAAWPEHGGRAGVEEVAGIYQAELGFLGGQLARGGV